MKSSFMAALYLQEASFSSSSSHPHILFFDLIIMFTDVSTFSFMNAGAESALVFQLLVLQMFRTLMKLKQVLTLTTLCLCVSEDQLKLPSFSFNVLLKHKHRLSFSSLVHLVFLLPCKCHHGDGGLRTFISSHWSL